MIIFNKNQFVANPLISVIIITYNQFDYIQGTISSILNQLVDFEYEIIIAEDCSTDKTKDVCLFNYANNQDKIKLILQNENIGLLQNYRNVLSECRGKYIAQCAGDDYWLDVNKLSKQLQLMETDSSFGMIHSDYYVKRDSAVELVEHKIKEIDFLLLLEHNHICAPTVMFKAEIINDYFKFIGDDYYEFLMEDYPFWLYISKFHKVGYIQEPLVVYRQLNHSVSNIKDPRKDIVFQFSVYNIKRYFIGRFNIDKSLIKEQVANFYVEALHVCYSLRLKEEYLYLNDNFKFWDVKLSRLNSIRLLSLKNGVYCFFVRFFFRIKYLLL